jgi:uncharacterized protein YjbI with pentapeptide repeats
LKHRNFFFIGINEIIDRNLIFREKKLAPAPSDTLVAAFKDDPEELLERTKSLNLQKRNLRFSNFFDSDLTKTDLREAQFQGANFKGAYLQGTNLFDAKFGKAGLAKKGMSDRKIRDQGLLKKGDLEQWAKEIPDSEMRELFKKMMDQATQQKTLFGNLPDTLKIRHACEKEIEGCGPLLEIPSLSEKDMQRLRKNIYRNLICINPVLVDIQLKNHFVRPTFILTDNEVKATQKVCEEKVEKK